MLFLFGEKLKTTTTVVGSFDCPCCGGPREFNNVVEKSYFCFFLIPLLPIKTEANFWQCSTCQGAFEPGNTVQLSYINAVNGILSYLLSGFGFSKSLSCAHQVFEKVCNKELNVTEIEKLKNSYTSIEAFMEDLKKHALHMDYAGKIQAVQVAYLFTYAVCKIEFDDRLRINLIGNAVGVSIEAINRIIDQLKLQGYLGIESLN